MKSIDEIWEGDLLDRKKEATFLLDFLNGRIKERQDSLTASSFVLSLNAPWGEGKTYFLERLSKQIELSGHTAVSINAWTDDYAEDPFVAIMAGIEAAMTHRSAKALSEPTRLALRSTITIGAELAAAMVKGAGKQLLHRYVGEEASKRLQDIVGSDAKEAIEFIETEMGTIADKQFDQHTKSLIEKFKSSKKTVSQFKSSLARFVAELSDHGDGPLFVLIDELDRCRPAYAIALLERIKHLFDVPRIGFVLATDSVQLAHALGAVYGPEFDSRRYLYRFFDQSYTLHSASKHGLVERLLTTLPIDVSKISLPDNNELVDLLKAGFEHFDLNARDIERTYDILRSVVAAWKLPVRIEILVLFPMVIGYHLKLQPDFSDKFVEELALHEVSQRSWTIKMYNRGADPNHSVMSVLQWFIRIGQHSPLLQILNDSESNPPKRWVYERFQDEFTNLHGNVVTRGRQIYSVLREYPDLVRCAGRLRSYNEVN